MFFWAELKLISQQDLSDLGLGTHLREFGSFSSTHADDVGVVLKHLSNVESLQDVTQRVGTLKQEARQLHFQLTVCKMKQQ